MSALHNLGTGLGEMMELETAERWLQECIGYAEAHDLLALVPALMACARACLPRPLGRRSRARRRRAPRVRRPDQPDHLLDRTRPRAGATRRPRRARRLDEAFELSLPGGHLQRLGHVHAARAEASWLAGDPARAVEESRAVYGLALEKRHFWFAGELAYWQWKAGALDDAPDWIAEPYRLQLGRRPAGGVVEAWRERLCPYEASRTLADADDESALEELERLGAAAARGRPSPAAGPPWAARDDSRESGRSHGARARGARTRRGRAAEPGDRGAARALYRAPSTITSRPSCRSWTRGRAARRRCGTAKYR